MREKERKELEALKVEVDKMGNNIEMTLQSDADLSKRAGLLRGFKGVRPLT